MRKLHAGLLVCCWLGGCDKLPKPIADLIPASSADTSSPVASSSVSRSLDPGNMWDRLELDEQKLAAEHPGLFKREGKTLTLFKDGRPLATFTDTFGPDDSATWRYLGPIALRDKGGALHTAHRLERGGIEFSEEVLLDPDGRLHEMGEAAQVSPDGRYIANGAFDEMSGGTFSLIDWPNRTRYAFDLYCETTSWETQDRALLACDGPFGPAVLSHVADGRWQVLTTGAFQQDMSRDADGHVAGGEVDPVTDAEPKFAKPSPLKDDTEYLATLGFTWLGEKR